MTQNYKTFCLSHLLSQESYDLHVWYTYVKGQYPQVFFSFFQNFVFWIIRGVKGQKMAQNDKIVYPLCILETIHHMIAIFGSHFYNDHISSHFFHFFKILIFLVFSRVKGQKMTQNYQFQSVMLFISGTVDHIIVIFGTQV